ncbi:MAG: acetate--CoA ligase family protein [Archaeoglobaceae archaeon]
MQLLMEHEAKELLERHGIATARCIFAESEEEAVKAAKLIGFPVVMKVASPKIVHKSDVGGVKLNVRSEEEVRRNFSELMKIEGAVGVNVQPMLPQGLEVIVGVAENEQFGSVAMFGLGGVFVEVLRDVSFRLLPLTKRDAEEMVKEIRGYRIFEYRGKRYDVKAIVDLLLKLNEIVEEESVIEMDLNPVFVYEKGCVVADARIVVGERRRFEYEVGDISFFFKPRSVAVVGASSNPLKVGYSVVKSLLKSDVTVYPVNPNLSELESLKVYPSVSSIEDDVDVAVIAVPAEKVLEVVRECAKKGVKGAIVISSGFREAEDERGKVLQEELRRIAKEEGIRIIGPNVFGIVSVVNNVNASFTPMFSELKKGKIALVSQSGGICHYILHNADVGFSHVIHLGNMCDVDFCDVFEFLANDESTEVVAVYVEGLDNGRSFYDSLKKLCSKKKVVVMKAGRSETTRRASLGHTGSMAGDWDVFRAAAMQAGAVFVETPIELHDIAKLLASFEIGDVAVLTIQAGLGIVACDIIEACGGRIAKLSEETRRKLRELLPPITFRDNPVDLSFSGLDLETFSRVVDAVSEDENVGTILFLYAVAPPSWVIPVEAVKAVLKPKKPTVIVYSSTQENYAEIKNALEKEGAIVFPSIERAARAVAFAAKRSYR